MEVTKYAPGTPSWVDVSSTNLSATIEFLKELFGWNATDMGEEAGHYTMFDVGGKSVAAAGPKMPGDPSPSAWTTYITVDSADDTVGKAKAAGGSVLLEPMDVF
ncbi:MAG TPA: VOC family protein, partial [Ilumatobacter sp.]